MGATPLMLVMFARRRRIKRFTIARHKRPYLKILLTTLHSAMSEMLDWETATNLMVQTAFANTKLKAKEQKRSSRSKNVGATLPCTVLALLQLQTLLMEQQELGLACSAWWPLSSFRHRLIPDAPTG